MKRLGLLKCLVGLFLACWISACGSSANFEATPNGVAPVSSRTTPELLDEISRLLQGKDLSSDSGLRAFLEGLGPFSQIAGLKVNVDRSIWIVFEDGQSLVVVSNRLPSPPIAPKAEVRARNLELPVRNQARLCNMFEGSQTFRSPVSSLLARLGPSGYGTTTEAGVEDLRGSGELGLFYFDTHGGDSAIASRPVEDLLPDGSTLRGLALRQQVAPMYALATSTRSTPALDETYKEELQDKVLIHFLFQIESTVYERRYGITGEFIKRHMKFSRDSLVFANACYSDNSSLKQAFLEAGAGGYLGWTGTVADGVAYSAAERLFDELLVSPDRNPVVADIDLAMNRLRLDGLGLDNFSNARLEFTLGQDFGLLLPALDRVEQKPASLVLHGQFGKVPGRIITNAGVELPRFGPWSAEELECFLPLNGQTVQVVVGERKSQALPLPQVVSSGTFEFGARGEVIESSEQQYPVGSSVEFHLRVVAGEVRDGFLRVEGPEGSFSKSFVPPAPFEQSAVTSTTLYNIELPPESRGVLYFWEFPDGTGPGSIVTGRSFYFGEGGAVDSLRFRLTILQPPPDTGDE